MDAEDLPLSHQVVRETVGNYTRFVSEVLQPDLQAAITKRLQLQQSLDEIQELERSLGELQKVSRDALFSQPDVIASWYVKMQMRTAFSLNW